MPDIQGFSNFIDDLMGGLQLVSLAIVVGGVAWAAAVLRVWFKEQSIQAVIIADSLRLLRLGAYLLAAAQLIELLMKAVILAAALGELPWAAYIGTPGFCAGLIRALLALVLGGISSRLIKSPADKSGWFTVAVLTVLLLVSGAWLVHGAGRLEDREPLMVTTVLHQFSAAVWFGGVVQFLGLWRLSSRHPEAKQLWPVVITRFSWLGIGAVTLLLATGIPLAWTYIRSWDGLLGTGYGNLVILKMVLLLTALSLAYLNFRAGRRWRQGSDLQDVAVKVPHYIETEAFVLLSVLFIAATLSSQPPAADIPELTASVAEVAAAFKPKLPRVTSPTRADLTMAELTGSAGTGDARSQAQADAEWSDYNHNMAGIFLTGMGLIAALSYTPWCRWATYWPLGFIGLSVFLFLRSDPEAWPLGPIGFWASTFGDGEVLQHRIATLLPMVLGLMEMRARVRATTASSRISYVFPILCAVGGILLLTHSHSGLQLKEEYLVQVTHAAMGLLAIMMACGRWLELKLATPLGRFAGFVAVVSMVLMGSILMFYREPIVYPTG